MAPMNITAIVFSIIATCLLYVFAACQPPTKSRESLSFEPKFTDFSINTSVRALQLGREEEVWFAGSRGIYGTTRDGGINWEIDSITGYDPTLEFRSIAVTTESVFLLNAGSPAYLFMSSDEGRHWETVYQDDHPDTFYDSMKFWDDKNGIAMGDPVQGCLSVIVTEDGGKNWRKLDCAILPPTDTGEAAFAASNTNIALYGQHVWLASGGSKARIYHSEDRGKTWSVYPTPMNQGGKMTGIFSVDFYNQHLGIAFGGDWENKSNNTGSKAITRDGGRSWQLVSDGSGPGYRSCVQYVPGSQGAQIIAAGTPGIAYSGDGGQTWQQVEKPDIYTVRVANNGQTAWLAGKNIIAKMDW